MDWSTEDVYKIVELYKRFPCLWDRTSLKYKKFNLKRNAWHYISKELKKPILEVKRKIKNLRSCYLLETKKVAESIKTAASPKEVYTPHLFYYEKMRFLEKVMFNPFNPIKVKENSSTNEVEFKDVELNAEQQNNNIVEFSPESDDNYSLHKENSQEDNFSERSFIYEESTVNSVNLNPIKGAKVEREEDLKTDRNKQNLSHAICSSFAKSIELQLSHLPIALATKAMADMQQILANYMGKMDRS